MSASDVRRDLSSGRFVSDDSELVTVDVPDAVRKISQQIGERYRGGQIKNEIGPTTYRQAEALYNLKKSTISSIPQPNLATLEELESKAPLREVHIALTAYTLEEGGIYREFNAKTRSLLASKGTLTQPFPFNAFLMHLWVGTRYVNGSGGTSFPSKLYRAVRCSSGNLSVGKPFAFPQFVSTTASKEVAQRFLAGTKNGAIFELYPKPGEKLYAIGLAHHSRYNEQEYLLAPVHAYTITGIRIEQGMSVIVCQVELGADSKIGGKLEPMFENLVVSDTKTKPSWKPPMGSSSRCEGTGTGATTSTQAKPVWKPLTSSVGLDICPACGTKVVGTKLLVKGQTYHPEHFRCAHCQQPIPSKTSYYTKNERIYCVDDYHRLFSPRCAGCKEIITGQSMTVKGASWHPEHFICSHCRRPIGFNKYYTKDDQEYCVEDYHKLFSPRCADCKQIITGRSITGMGSSWHPEHFTCAHCRKSLDGEQYYEKDGKSYCLTDYPLLFNPKCKGCGEPVLTKKYKDWHPHCYVCKECGSPPAEGKGLFNVAGNLFCTAHYKSV